jgi:hypothetical protein
MRYAAPTVKLGRMVGGRKLLALDDHDLETHLYILGATRTGKTKFMENILWQLIVGQGNTGPGLLLLDPHGTLYHDLARRLADHPGFKPRVLFVDPSRSDFVVPYNILRKRIGDDGREADSSVVARMVLNTMSYVWGADGTQETPRFHRIASNLLRTLYVKGYTTNEAWHFLQGLDRDLRRALVAGIDLPTVAAHWQLLDTMIQREFIEAVESTMNRFEPLVSQPYLTRMFGHPERSIDFRRAMDEGWIILCNLATVGSQIMEDDAHLLGTLFLSDLWATAKDRGKGSGQRSKEQRPFVVAIDEVQNFITPTIAKSLSEASGFGLRLILAHQLPSQILDDPRHEKHGALLFKSLLTNARNKAVFGGLAHDEDLAPLAEALYRGVLDPDQVKHVLYGTKVLEYRLEYEKAYSRSHTTTDGGSTSHGRVSGSGSTRSTSHVATHTYDADGSLVSSAYASADMEAFNSHLAETFGEQTQWASADSEGETDIPMLKPILGQEASSVQFRPLDEQRYLAMAALYDQEQRQCVVRLVGMHELVNVFTPFIEDGFSSDESLDCYIATSYRNWPDLVLPAAEATRLVEERRAQIQNLVRNALLADEDEPMPIKRRGG